MGEPGRVPQEQLRALDRLSAVPGIESFYLAGGTAVAFHAGHRQSLDLDLFSREPAADLTLPEAGAAYVARFGVRESDLYHVARALTFFDDAEKDPALPRGMSPKDWRDLRSFFTRVAPELLG